MRAQQLRPFFMQSRNTYIAGRHPVAEALESDQEIDKIIMAKGARGESIDKITRLCREKDIPLQWVPEIKLDKEVRGVHQGVAALMSMVTYHDIQTVLDEVMEKGEDPLIIVLDEVSDVRNLGAIARTAYGMGAHALVIPSRGSAPIQADAMKTSAGALMHLPVCRVNSLVATLRDLKLNGVHICGIHAHTDDFIESIDSKMPLAIVMGAEDTGISPAVRKEVQSFYKIPIQDLESYNVSVATAITLYQIVMNRK